MEKKIFKLFLFPFFMIALFSCVKKGNKSNLVQAASKTESTESAQPQILFLDIQCFKNKSGKDTCVLGNKILVDGRLKKQSNHFHEEEPGTYTCVFLDQDNKELNRVTVENPLKRRMEVYLEGGKITSDEVKFDSSSFSLRIPYEPSMYQLKIVQYFAPTSQHIATLNLFQK